MRKRKRRKRRLQRKMKKRLISVILCMVMLALSLTACGGGDKKTLRVYNAGEYIDKTLLTDFEKEYNCKVVYETFDSNEAMYTKVMSGSEYDIIIPSDYMVERLIKEDYLQPIDKSLIPNMSKITPNLLGKDFDPDNTYTVPYFWGSVGIIYDKTIVSEEDAAQGWDLLLNDKYKGQIYMYDSERDAFMIALKALGYSMNTDNKAELDAAYEWLCTQRDTMEPVYVGDDVIDNMISGNMAIAVVYSGDGAYIMAENENIAFVEPEQGTNLWYDSMVITKNCTETELAHQFINFMLEEDNAYANTQFVGYSSPVTTVYEKMRDEDYAGIDAYVPRTGYAQDEVFGYQETEIKSYCADLWTKVKAH